MRARGKAPKPAKTPVRSMALPQYRDPQMVYDRVVKPNEGAIRYVVGLFRYRNQDADEAVQLITLHLMRNSGHIDFDRTETVFARRFDSSEHFG